MKKFALAGAALAVLAAAPTLAQPPGDSARRLEAPITRADVQSRTEARFQRLDTNRDGFITQAEVAARAEAGRAERSEQRGERRAQLFDRLDANHNGSISREEFENRPAFQGGGGGGRREARAERGQERFARRGGRAGPRGAMAGRFGMRIFEAMDANRDGRVSLAEASSGALERFDRLDANRDGRITMEERQAARAARGERRGG